VKLSIKEIVDNLELQKNYEYIKNALEKMSNTTLKIRKPNEKAIYIPLVQKAIYDPENGEIEVIFNQEMKPYLLPLKYFTEPNLVSILSFKSKYTPMFYNYVKMLKQTTKKNEIILNFDSLIVILGLDSYYLTNFSKFRVKILEKVIKDFNNEYCDLKIDKYETIRIGRKIKRIKLFIKKNLNKKKNRIKFSNLKIHS
jgi:plasmid replication initiation protein